MGTLTIRMPDATHDRLKQLARSRNVSVNKLVEEFSTAALAEFDAETRFLARAARGNAKRGLALLPPLPKRRARPSRAAPFSRQQRFRDYARDKRHR